MKRWHLIEISDEPWCPRGIRRAVTDFCRVVTQYSHAFDPIAPRLAAALQKTGARRVLDLGSGAAGPWLGLYPRLRELGLNIPICLSDYDPNLEALEQAQRVSQGAITFHPQPVDATKVPAELSGFRTMFSAFHHLRPAEARAVLADAVARRDGVGIFECANRSLLPILLVPIATPIRVLLVTPFIQPFRWSRLFWTYLVPLVTPVLTWDSVVSCLRVYDVDEVRELTTGLEGYDWDIGLLAGRAGIPITYLIGTPKEPAPEIHS
jgi:hypothetical protein